jgi:hypothetical protein
MLSYFAAWILKAGNPVFKRAVRSLDPLGKADEDRSRQLRDDGRNLAR